MDFELSVEQKEIKKAVREFALKEFKKERSIEFELKEEFPWELYKKAAQLGFIGVWIPEKYGGQGYGTLETVLIIEEFTRVDSTLSYPLWAAETGLELIHLFGTEEQKEKYLPPIAAGEGVVSQAFTEPDHGSDLTLLSTTAVKDGDEYVINGVKTFITSAPYASFFIVLCQTNLEAKPPYRGQSLFIVDRKTRGIDVIKLEGKMGLKTAATAEVSFDDVRVSKNLLLGVENQGFYQVMQGFNIGRVKVAAQGVGLAQGTFDRALEYAKKREQFGRRIADFQVIQHKLANMATKIEVARLLTYKAAWKIDRGAPDPALSSMAKTFAAEVANEVVDEALQIYGGYGYYIENEIERYYRDARVIRIYEGTDEIQKNVIAKSLIS
jgi:alkylation response protein AidB-like acyl-CoA dehydrogenase